jgi:hypothetical protein
MEMQRKVLDEWRIKTMREVFEALNTLAKVPEFRALVKANQSPENKNKLGVFFYNEYDWGIEVCDALLERMEKERKRVEAYSRSHPKTSRWR